MSFYGSSFSFDGKSCEEFGLMLYDFGNTTQGNSKFASVNILEDRVYQRPRSLFYGSTYKDPLEFKLVFGANEDRATHQAPFDRCEVSSIASWLTDQSMYKWLEIHQEDMEGIRYRCIISDLEVLEVGMQKWAFQCTVHCDSPYAYTYPQKMRYAVNGTLSVRLFSPSTANVLFTPTVEIALNQSSDFTIENITTGQIFSIAGFPQTSDTITVHGASGVITSSSNLNVYPYCNFKWPNLYKGYNIIKLTGVGDVVFTCEFPMNIGG